MTAYQVWRKQLHELQQKIDNFDESFDYTRPHEEYQSERQPLVDELEAHYAKEGSAID